MDNEKTVLNTEEAVELETVEEAVEVVAEESVQLFEETCEEVQEEVEETEEFEETDELPQEEAPKDYRQMILAKCAEVQNQVKGTAARISRDLEETHGNPYFRQTITYKLEVLRSPEDDEPVDVFEMEQTRSFSLCSLSLIGTASLLLKNAGEKLLKKLKED